MILYTKPFQAIRGRTVSYVEGRAVILEPAPATVALNVQSVRGANDDLVAFGDPGTLTARDAGSQTEGDVVIVNGQRYIVTSVDRWDAFGGAETMHDSYTLAQEIPKGPGEP